MAKDIPHPFPHPPYKPYPEFPLFWHARGYWCKKRNGRQVNYGSDWEEALRKLHADEDRLAEGKPLQRVLSHTFRDAVNAYLDRQESRCTAGEITGRHFARCRTILEDAAKHLGMTTKLHHFAGDESVRLFTRLRTHLLKLGTSRAVTAIGTVRACLDYAARQRLMPPPAYGDEFDKPSAKDQRQARHASGDRAFTADEVRRVIAFVKDRPQMLAYVLLGINCGMGAGDIASLPRSAVDLAGAVIRFPRPKTAMPRICPLWPETVEALKAVPKRTPVDPQHVDRFFLSRTGKLVSRTNLHSDDKGISGFTKTDLVQNAFGRAIRRCKIDRKGAGFYSLRSAFRTLAIGSGADGVLVSVILGHGYENPMDAFYVRGDLLPKLRAVTDFVRGQVIPKTSDA